MSKKAAKSERAVMVTTAHRGVFVGYTTDAALDADTITLTRARMIVYYSRETRGVLGIASLGVAPGSRVSPPVDRIVIRNITAVVDATQGAAAAWEAEPWG
jgi:hypothetical protein